MIHLEGHPHSFVKDDVVLSTSVFDGHDHELIDKIRVALEADWVQCNCDYQRFITPGAIWNGTDFRYPSRQVWNGTKYEEIEGPIIPREPEPIVEEPIVEEPIVEEPIVEEPSE